MEIKARIIIEIAGFPEEHVEKTMKMVLDRLNEEKDIIVIDKKVSSTKQVEKIWTAFAELELKFKDLKILNDFCFNYMPSSVEILEPLKIDANSADISDLLNDLLARLHNFTMFVKNLQAENIILKREKESNDAGKK